MTVRATLPAQVPASASRILNKHACHQPQAEHLSATVCRSLRKQKRHAWRQRQRGLCAALRRPCSGGARAPSTGPSSAARARRWPGSSPLTSERTCGGAPVSARPELRPRGCAHPGLAGPSDTMLLARFKLTTVAQGHFNGRGVPTNRVPGVQCGHPDPKPGADTLTLT